MKWFLNCGCGSDRLESKGDSQWMNIDINPECLAADFREDYLDMDKRFGENQIDGIFICHSLEHLEYPEQTVRFFEKALKMLMPGGTLRIVVPDLWKICKAYCEGMDMTFIYGKDFKGYYHKPESAAERLHFFLSGAQWEHKICFDAQLLTLLAKDAGFIRCCTVPSGVSDIPELNNIDRFQSESVSFECQKP